MTQQQIERGRIAIAERCGWKKLYKGPEPDNRWIQPDGVHYATTDEVPNYHSSLDAMHEAVASIKGQERGVFYIKLEMICDRDNTHPYDATAPQRFEAFLRTIGKWEE